MATGDVGNTAVCSRSGCGHKGSFHADTATGDNTGKCSFIGCKCTAFQAAATSSNTTRPVTAVGGTPAVLATDEQRAHIDPAAAVAGPANPTQVSPDGPQFRAVLIREGVDTDDERAIAPNALTWRELPMSLMVLTVTGPGGHQGAAVGARIDTIERQPGNDPGTFDIVAFGHLDTGAVGLEATRMIGNQTLRGVSADLVACEGYVEVLEEDEDGFILKQRETLTAGKIAAATVCPIPAFNGCTIALTEETDDMVDQPEQQVPALVASGYTLPAFRIVDEGRCLPCEAREQATITASGGPMAPPAGWFADPGLDRLTAFTIDDDGRVYGHLAAWDTCHTGIDGQCVVAPRSSSNYAFYSTGAVRCADGSDVPTGPITLGGGHAEQTLDADATRAHYDESGWAVADVAAGEDAHGIWVAGALRPDVTDLQVRQLRACALSGDWRRIGGRFELVAALAVNHPGFPVARVASGVPMSLVAAGARAVAKQARPWRDDIDAVRRELAAELAQTRADRAMARIRR